MRAITLRWQHPSGKADISEKRKRQKVPPGKMEGERTIKEVEGKAIKRKAFWDR